MNFLTGKHLDRRTLLRGMGAAIALPALGRHVSGSGGNPRKLRVRRAVWQWSTSPTASS